MASDVGGSPPPIKEQIADLWSMIARLTAERDAWRADELRWCLALVDDRTMSLPMVRDAIRLRLARYDAKVAE